MIIYLIIHLVQIVHQGFQVLFLAHASQSWKIAGVGTTTSITDASAIWILHSGGGGGTLKWERGGKWSNKKCMVVCSCILCILRIYRFLLTVSWHCPVSNKKTINNIKVMIFKLCCSTKERGLLLLLDDDDAISIFILLRMRCQVKKRRRRCICVLYIHAWKKSKSSVEKMREINDE